MSFFFDSSVSHLPAGWFLPKMSLIFIPLGTLLNFFKTLWEFSHTTIGWHSNLALLTRSGMTLGPIHPFQHWRASSINSGTVWTKPWCVYLLIGEAELRDEVNWVENLITEASNVKLHPGLQRTPTVAKWANGDNVFLFSLNFLPMEWLT